MQVKQQQVVYRGHAIFWFFNDNSHRDNDLPTIYYFQNRKLYSVYYYQHGKTHRTTGPAVIDYLGKIKWYYYRGRKYDSLEELQMVGACR